MGYVFPNCVTVVRWNGSRVHLNPGQQWLADDPFVRARPEFFDTDPDQASSTAPRAESATSGPNEVRATPRKTTSTRSGKATGKSAPAGE